MHALLLRRTDAICAGGHLALPFHRYPQTLHNSNPETLKAFTSLDGSGGQTSPTVWVEIPERALTIRWFGSGTASWTGTSLLTGPRLEPNQIPVLLPTTRGWFCSQLLVNATVRCAGLPVRQASDARGLSSTAAPCSPRC